MGEWQVDCDGGGDGACEVRGFQSNASVVLKDARDGEVQVWLHDSTVVAAVEPAAFARAWPPRCYLGAAPCCCVYVGKRATARNKACRLAQGLFAAR